MTFASDDRARVPFALVGILLLVSSATYTGVLTTQRPVPDRTPVERAVATATTETHLAVERAAIEASANAAKNPVVTPANTSMGRVLEGDDPFERYLRLRIYRRARMTLLDVSSTTGRNTVTAHLPRIRTPSDARAAINRTRIEPVDEGRRIRITLENVTLRIERGGSLVGTHDTTISVVAATPVLALHRRTTGFDRRLSNGPYDGPGLGRRLTAGLLVTAQTRGLAQYGGAPISNLVANRHVEVISNAAALSIQHDSFGAVDSRSAGAVAWAAGRVVGQDLLAMQTQQQTTWGERVLTSSTAATPGAARAALQPNTATESGRRNVSARQVADRALVAVVSNDRVTRAVERAYTIDARLVIDRQRISRRTHRDRAPPIDGILGWTNTSTSHHVRAGVGATLSAPVGFDLVEADSRRVVTTKRVTETWQTTTGPVHVVETTTTVTAVEFGVATRYAPSNVPVRQIADTVGRRRLDDAAVDRLLGTGPRRDGLARAIATGDVNRDVQRVAVSPPAAVLEAARDAVVATHHRTRNVTTQSDVGAADRGDSRVANATGVRELAREVESRRPMLVDAPARYRGPAAVATTAARVTYLDAVDAELSADEARIGDTGGAIRSLLEARGRSIPSVSAGNPLSNPQPGDRATGVSVRVTPAYLPVSRVTPQMANVSTATYPLAARNVNLFTLPSGEVADAVAGTLVPKQRGGHVDLAVAARTLAVANDAALPDNRSLATSRRDLRANVEDATATLASTQVRTIARSTPLTPTQSVELVDDVLSDYRTVPGRALALTNGTISTRLAARATAGTEQSRSVLAARLRVAVNEKRSSREAMVPAGTARKTGSLTRAVARDSIRLVVEAGIMNATERLKTRHLSEKMAALPAGLPVAPVPGSWYATVNVWLVDVRGAYHRVEVRSTAASPALGDDGVTYVRESRTVTLDVDGDGTPERLGRNEEVAFSVSTVAFAIVPAGPNGVGDTDGNMDERSPGWPGPTAALNETTGYPRNESGTTPPIIGSP